MTIKKLKFTKRNYWASLSWFFVPHLAVFVNFCWIKSSGFLWSSSKRNSRGVLCGIGKVIYSFLKIFLSLEKFSRQNWVAGKSLRSFWLVLRFEMRKNCGFIWKCVSVHDFLSIKVLLYSPFIQFRRARLAHSHLHTYS